MSQSIHNGHLNKLYRIVKEDYLVIIKNMEFGPYRELKGEVDLVGISTNIFDLYEVKINKKYKLMEKAVYQLTNARKWLGQEGKEFVYTPQGGIQPLDEIIKELNGKKR